MLEWRQIRLGDVAQKVTVGHVGPMASEYLTDGIPFLRSQNVTPHGFDLADVKYIGPEFHASLRKSALRPGDVVTVRTGKPGATAVVPPAWKEANCADLVITRPGPELDSRWLSYYINSAASVFISSQLVGAVQQHFNVGAAKAMSLLLPSLDEQKAIADVLGALDDKIAANANLIALADALVRLRWELVERSSAGTTHVGSLVTEVKESVDPVRLDANTIYVGLEHIPRRTMWQTDFGYAGSVNSQKTRFCTGDILFGKLRPYFHKVTGVPFDGICSTDVVVSRPNGKELAGFALAAISSDSVVAQCTAASEGTRMPRSNWKDLSAAVIPWPGVTKVQEISSEVSAFAALAGAVAAESRTLSELRDTLLPQLMSGKLLVKDAEKQVEAVV